MTALAVVLCLAIGTTGCLPSPPADEPTAATLWRDAESADPPSDPATSDGTLPVGATISDEHLPGIANLRPDLRDAVRRATEDAARDGIEIRISGGWRSADLQRRLLAEAIDEYGSPDEAARWVASAETSAHVSGDAVDIAPFDAIDWLVRHGVAYDLCQTYGNESWHWELRPGAAEDGCPAAYPDPTYDPRMQG